jgi:glycerol-3-phosphate dehydrogenase
MVRDLRRLADTHFDLVVVGAGFYGAIAAWDATLRGLSVALIDKDDFGSGTSFNNLKTLHGGLRSLQAFNFPQMRLFIQERRALARVAPHLVRPLPFVVPTYRDPRRSAMLMRLALAVNDVVARDRNEGLRDPAIQLPRSEIISREDCLRLNPIIDRTGVTAGAVWHDYQVQNTDRMTLSFVLSAAEKNAATANYVRATRFLAAGSRVEGVRVAVRQTGDEFDVRGRAVLNAAGPWAASLLSGLDSHAAPAVGLSRAMNVITRPVVTGYACGGLARGRFLFVVPWRNVSILGTSHDAHEGSPEALGVTRSDLEMFLADAHRAFPGAELTAADVRLVHRGLLPMISGSRNHVQLLRESVVIDHREHNVHGLVSMFGVRYTTARHTAARAIDTVFKVLGHRDPPACRTAVTPVTGGDIEDKESFVRAAGQHAVHGAPAGAAQRLALTYGTGYQAVLQPMREYLELAEPLGRNCAVTGAEIVHAAQHESAVTLADAFIRRTEAGSAGHPGSDAIERAAYLMARYAGWNQRRAADEIADVESFYELP